MPTIFASGTKTIFNQTSAPIGWTKDTTFNNAALRVVNGSASSGGSTDFSSFFSSRTFTSSPFGAPGVGSTSLSTPQIAPHGHINTPSPFRSWSTPSFPGTTPAPGPTRSRSTGFTTSNMGNSSGTSGFAHNHPVNFLVSGQVGNFNIKYTDMIIASKN